MTDIMLMDKDKENLLGYVNKCVNYYTDQYHSTMKIVLDNKRRYKTRSELYDLANKNDAFFDTDTLKAYGRNDINFDTNLDNHFAYSYSDMLKQDISMFKELLFDNYNMILKKIIGNYFFNHFSHHIPLNLVDYIDTKELYKNKDINLLFEELQQWWDEFIVTTEKPHYNIYQYAEYINGVYNRINHKNYLDNAHRTIKSFSQTNQFKNLIKQGKNAIKLPAIDDFGWFADELDKYTDSLLEWMESTYAVDIKSNKSKEDKLQIGKTNYYDNEVLRSINIYKNKNIVLKFQNEELTNTWIKRFKKLIGITDKKTINH